jgi:DNA-binding NarL/FixJ family response regulator
VDSRGKVLIVDDMPANLSLLSDTLDRQGYMVLIAINGAAAIQQVSLLKPDIILLDAIMPKMDGFATCRALKSATETQEIPVVFMTAMDDADAVVQAFQAGATDYVTKPVRQEELLARISTHMRQARLVTMTRHALDGGGRAGIVVDSTGRILWQTPHAAEYLEYLHSDDVLLEAQLPPVTVDWLMREVRNGVPSTASHAFQCAGLSLFYTGDINPDEYYLTIECRHKAPTENTIRTMFDLTQREAQVLLWVSRGKTNSEIATILGMSARTVSKHLEHIFEKLGVETRTAAAARVNHDSSIRDS